MTIKLIYIAFKLQKNVTRLQNQLNTRYYSHPEENIKTFIISRFLDLILPISPPSAQRLMKCHISVNAQTVTTSILLVKFQRFQYKLHKTMVVHLTCRKIHENELCVTQRLEVARLLHFYVNCHTKFSAYEEEYKIKVCWLAIFL